MVPRPRNEYRERSHARLGPWLVESRSLPLAVLTGVTSGLNQPLSPLVTFASSSGNPVLTTIESFSPGSV